MANQTATFHTQTGATHIELPAPNVRLLNNVLWGEIDAFPTPAYWRCQVLSRRVAGTAIQYKLGRTLAEETGACLLGGHGIPAVVGLAAYDRLRDRGAFDGERRSEEELEAWLREPLVIGDRHVRYRFARQKAKYLAAVLPAVADAPSFNEGRALRDWLLDLPGIGPKTASWIVRNWMDADDVAILDIHIMRVGQLIGLFPRDLTVERHYGALETLFVDFSRAIDVRTSELDALVWHEMASSPGMVRLVMDVLERTSPRAGQRAKARQQSLPLHDAS